MTVARGDRFPMIKSQLDGIALAVIAGALRSNVPMAKPARARSPERRRIPRNGLRKSPTSKKH